ncbi:MAG: DNA-3-methyladenine glycosylase I [Rhodobacteraceae bacterium]|nr:DNA-3-methyladenine glycosylase I [Paracoccaceae bacterium]
MSETRCDWCGSLPIYVNYHDEEWGVPEYDSRALWEKLVLDGFQAGLSWLTILKKREAFRAAFAGFDPEKVARFGAADVERLLGDPGIIRHRGKIEAAITGAQAWLELEEGKGFAPMMWDYVDGRPLVNRFETMAEVPPSSDLSLKISKDLKKLGFKFCGPTIVYAWMEATGLINDHLITCHRHEAVKKLAR